MSESPWSRIRSASLSTKLILFSALLTALAVGVAFLALSLELRKQTRRLLADTLAQHQRMILHLQQESLGQLLRSSRLMTESPTLRAAIDTYRSEAARGPHVRPDRPVKRVRKGGDKAHAQHPLPAEEPSGLPQVRH